MITFHGCESRLILLIAISGTWAVTASGQTLLQESTTPSSFACVRAHVPVGAIVHVTDASGSTVKGRLTTLTDEAVHVTVRSDMISLRSVAPEVKAM
jgi:hypothetical protein